MPQGQRTKEAWQDPAKREAMLAGMRAKNSERWTPEARAAWGKKMQAMWTPEKRVEAGIVGRKGGDQSKRGHRVLHRATGATQ